MNAMRRIDSDKVEAVSDALHPKQKKTNPQSPPLIESDTLFAGGSEIRIAHSGSHYRLTITRQGKLILTK